MNNDVASIVRKAWELGTAIPAFNIPYLPMMEPVVRALRDTRCVGMIAVARLEWRKFRAISPEAVRDTYRPLADERVTRLHMDHVPVIDEDGLRVDALGVLRDAVALGYDSVMVDGSRLPLEDNIAAVREVVAMAHAENVPVEAELGAILGHESGPLPPYEELFRSGRGFTDVEEAARFAQETDVDWLSIAVGNVHGAISAARKEKKIAARLDIEHLAAINARLGLPLVLHGGTGIPTSYVRDAVANGIAKINIATAIRQPYEALVEESEARALDAVYAATVRVISDDLKLTETAEALGTV